MYFSSKPKNNTPLNNIVGLLNGFFQSWHVIIKLNAIQVVQIEILSQLQMFMVAEFHEAAFMWANLKEAEPWSLVKSFNSFPF